MSAARGLRAPIAWLAAGLLAAASFAAQAQEGLVPIPKLAAHATDLTGTLTVTELAAIEEKLAAFERAKGSQVAVLMVPTIGAEPIEDFALRVTDAWKLGRKGVDDGVLFVIAKQQRKIRIQTGRGVQGTLTDVTSGRIIRERVTPAFRDGNFAAGIEAGVDAILKAIEGEALPPVKAGTTTRKVDTLPSSGFDFLWLAFLGVPVVAMILRPMVGRAGSAVATGGIAGVGAWIVFGTIIAGAIGAIIAFVLAISMGTNALRQGRRGGGAWIPGGGFGGGSWGGGGGGGGFSGGGGGFDGGGASGDW